jgi:hypothetical protein
MRIIVFQLPLILLAFSPVLTYSQTSVTFDDLQETAGTSFITNGYQGLVWSNFYCANGIIAPIQPPRITNGYYYGTVSASNMAFNGLGTPAEIDSPGTNFNFLSAYFTGAWHSNLNIEVEGFNGTNLIYDQTVVAGATNPILFTFDYADINRLYFNSFGGQVAFGYDGGSQFVMDNFTFEFVPEPSSLLLAALGGMSLVALLRRRRK